MDLQHGYFTSIVFTITMTISSLFATTIEKKVGLKLTIILGTLIQNISYFILLFSKNFFLDLLAYFIFGLSLAPLMLMPRNLMYFFFEIRGKLSGALSIEKAILSSAFNTIAEKIMVNPESDEADVDEKFYTYEVSKRFLNVVIMNIIISIICCIFVVIIIVPYDKKKHGKGLSFSGGKKPSEKDDENSPINSPEENEEEKTGEKNKLDNTKKEKKQSFKASFMKNALKNRRIIFLALISIFSSPLGIFFIQQWMNIAIRNNIPTSYQQNVLAIAPFVNCFSQLIFGWLSDSISYRYIYSILSFVLTFISIIFCFTFQSPFLFSACVLLFGLASNGNIAISAPHFMKVFGLKYYIEISTIIRIPSTILNPVNLVLMYLFESKLGDTSSVFTPFFILYIILGGLNAIAAILSCFETEDIFISE